MTRPNAIVLARRLEQIARELSRFDRTRTLPVGQWAILRQIRGSGRSKPTVKRIAMQLNLSDAQAAIAVASLLRKGLVSEVGTVGEGSRLTLTGEGNRLMQSDPIARVERAIAGLSEEERHQLSHLLDALHAEVVNSRSQ